MLIVLTALLAAQAMPAAAPWTVVTKPYAGRPGQSVSADAAAKEGGARLVVKCDRAGAAVVSLQFIPTTRLATGGVVPVSLRFNGGTPLVANWERMGGGAIEREDGAVTTLAADLAKARSIALHLVEGTTPIDFTFAGPATDAGIRQILAACGYTLGQLPLRDTQPAAASRPADAGR